MPWTYPGTGQEFNTIPEQIHLACGCVPVIKQVIAVLVCLGSGVNAYLMINEDC
jgi:hypothetical protein